MGLDDDLQLVMGLGSAAVGNAALIWARATALRDRRPEPSTGEEKMPGIQRRLGVAGAKLLLARRDDAYVGFALFAPHEENLEIFYLAVDPDSWGNGVANALLIGAEEHARAIGRAVLELWVINDNDRALGVYARSGFVDTEQLHYDESSGRLERRMIKEI